MSQSTNAIIFYGIHLGDPNEIDEEWYRKLPDPQELDDEDSDEYDKFGPLQEKLYDFKNPPEVQIGTHCSVEYPMYYIYYRDSQVTAYRGTPKESGDQMRSIRDTREWDKKIAEFCVAQGIPYSQPKWYLVSYWG